MSDGDNMISEQAEGYKALFVVVVTVIEDRGCGSREDLFAVHEIDTVFTKVDFALSFVPVEFHVYDTIVTTICSYGKTPDTENEAVAKESPRKYINWSISPTFPSAIFN